MTTYRADIPDTVHATKRIQHIIIPVFNFKGSLAASESDKWYPPTSFKLTAGYITSTEPGSSAAIIEVWKHRFHRQFDGKDTVDSTRLAVGSLSLSGVKGILGLVAADYASKVTPKDYITVKAINDSGHGGVVVQLFGDKA